MKSHLTLDMVPQPWRWVNAPGWQRLLARLLGRRVEHTSDGMTVIGYYRRGCVYPTHFVDHANR